MIDSLSRNSHTEPTTRRIGFNLLFIVGGNLTGPGYYAVQLFEHIIRLNSKTKVEFIGYIQPDAARHFSDNAQKKLKKVRNFRGRFSRVFYEQSYLPVLTRRDGLSILFSPAFVSPLWGAPHLVVTICDMYYRTIPRLLGRAQRSYWHMMIPPSVRRCERVITISDNSKRDIEHFIPNARGKTISIPLASRFTPAEVPPYDIARHGARPFVLMVANLTVNKNCEVVVEAMKIIRREGIDLEFVHVGSDLLGLLAASVAYHGADEYVRSVGKISDVALEALYRSCMCAVVPSLYEGFAMPVLEAQAHAAPLICSDRSAIPEVAGEGALFFDPTDVEALVQHLRRLNSDAVLRKSIGEVGVRNAARYSWHQTAKRTMMVFNEILCSNSSIQS